MLFAKTILLLYTLCIVYTSRKFNTGPLEDVEARLPSVKIWKANGRKVAIRYTAASKMLSRYCYRGSDISCRDFVIEGLI